MMMHGCDCSEGATFEGAVYFPHPVGIVIGAGACIGDGVWIYQNVTVGATSKGHYPRIERGARLYPGSLIAGDMSVGESAIVGAGIHVRTEVPAGSVLRAQWAKFDEGEGE